MRLIAYCLMCIIGAMPVQAKDVLDKAPKFSTRRDLPRKADFRAPWTAPTILVRHSLGFAEISVRTRKGDSKKYVRNGKGEALPINVFISMPLLTERDVMMGGISRRFNRQFTTSQPYSFRGHFLSPQNKKAVVSMAIEVLAGTFCSGGEVKENHKYLFVDKRGSEPKVRYSELAIATDGGWSIKLSCSRWRARN